LISDDDDELDSTGGRRSGLSEPPTHEDMSTDDLFASTLDGGHHSSLSRDVIITSVDTGHDSRDGPLSAHHFRREVFEPVCILSTHIKEEKMDEDDEVLDELDEDEVDRLMMREVISSRGLIASPIGRQFRHSDSGLGSLSPLGRPSSQELNQLPDSTMANSSSPTSTSPVPGDEVSSTLNHSDLNDSAGSTTVITTASNCSSIAAINNSNNTINSNVIFTSNTSNVNNRFNSSSFQLTHAIPVTHNGTTSTATTVAGTATAAQPLDIKILPAGLLQLAANLAAVFPSNGVQKQIAIQLLREDGECVRYSLTLLTHSCVPS